MDGWGSPCTHLVGLVDIGTCSDEHPHMVNIGHGHGFMEQGAVILPTHTFHHEYFLLSVPGRHGQGFMEQGAVILPT